MNAEQRNSLVDKEGKLKESLSVNEPALEDEWGTRQACCLSCQNVELILLSA